MQKDSAMRLLIVEDQVEDAEAIVSAVRNGGIAVRPLRPQNVAELEQMVTSQPADLVLAGTSTTMPRTPPAASPTRARCRARARTPCGSVTC